MKKKMFKVIAGMSMGAARNFSSKASIVGIYEPKLPEQLR